MNQGEFRTMRSIKGLWQAGIVAVLFLTGSGLFAQDALPETPPELRDFRLDPEPQPRAETVTEPVAVAPPPVARTVPTIPQRGTEPPRQRTQSTPAPAEALPAPPEAAAVTTETSPTVVPSDAPRTDNVKTPTVAPQADPTATSIPIWPIIAGLGLFALLLWGAWHFLRHPKVANFDDPPAVKPVSRQPPANSVNTEPARQPTGAVTSTSTPEVSRLVLDFVPEKAMVSFSALTVKGQMSLMNQSTIAATSVELSAGLMSASNNQNHKIQEFYKASTTRKGQPVGDVKPGERIGMTIELSIPLTEMESFTVGDQKLLVPIMVASLRYFIDGEENSRTTEIACMIGREANPPTSKMAPLRLDLGPRSFAPLGQRIVHA